MKLPEGYLPRENDVVILHGTVKYNVEPADESVHVRVAGMDYRDVMVPLDKIVGIHARHWAIGDKVLCNDGDSGTVAATQDGMAWIKLASGAFTTYACNDLRENP